MNIRCPNCGAVFPGPAAGQEAECPLCLHCFSPDGNATVSSGASAAPPRSTAASRPRANSDDEFESFGAPLGSNTTTFGGGSFSGDSLSSGDGDGLSADSFGSDPFAASNAKSGAGADFGSSNGFGAAATKPFDEGRRTDATKSDDPFALPGAGGEGDVDFGALLGNVGEPSGEVDDLFGLPSGGGDDSLFGNDDDDDPFARADAMQDDALFGDDEDSLFLATANTSGAIFDDEGDDLISPHASSSERNDPTPAPHQPRKQGDDKRRKRDWGPLLDRFLGLSLIVLIGGVAAEYQGIPAFGLGDLLPSLGLGGDRNGGREGRVQLRPIPQNLADPTDIKDTGRTYQLEIERLKKVREVRPKDPKILLALVNAYLDLLERAPTIYFADHSYAKELKMLRAKLPTPSLRYAVLDLVARGDLLPLEKKIDELTKNEHATADDIGSAAWALWRYHQALQLQDALDNPGRISDPSIDPLLRADPTSKKLQRARVLAQRALTLAKGANNRLKFVMIKAQIDDQTGHHAENMDALRNFVPTAKAAVGAHLLYIAGLIRSNHLGKAATAVKALTAWAQDEGNAVAVRRARLHEAWLAHKRGRVDEQLTALVAAQVLDPDDELVTVRLGRILLREKRAQECYKLLSAAKKRGLKSIAFEVALVEYWLWAHRNNDALAEIKEATKNFPESVDLLYLRGQVEEQQHHTATARDFYGKVIAREPKHLRAALRLATLQSKAGRHDDALSTLSHVKDRLGPLESVLELMAKELLTLRRTAEARAIYAQLLKRHPSHKMYLLQSARMDVQAGRIDSALRFLLALQSQGALDREGAQQLAMALASKGKSAKAAKTLVKFADREPNDIRLNALSGQYMLDSGNVERAETLLKRAFRVAHRQGGDAETLFQYGRLAFRKRQISNGISRTRQAIRAAPKTHHYRYAFAKSLLLPENLKWPSAGAMAVTQLKWLIAHADRLEAADNRIDYIADVYRILARYYFDTKRFALAIPLLQKSLNIEPKHLATQVQLGNALFRVSDPRAEQVLRKVLRQRPNNFLGALYLGLTLQNRGRITESITWLTRATRGKNPQLAEAWYQLAMIYRDRNQRREAKRCLRAFLQRAPADDPFRSDAVGVLKQLGG